MATIPAKARPYRGEPLEYDGSRQERLDAFPPGSLVHTSRPKHTGVIVEVQPGEITWNSFYQGWVRDVPVYRVLVPAKKSGGRLITTHHVEHARRRLAYFTKLVDEMEEAMSTAETLYNLYQNGTLVVK